MLLAKHIDQLNRPAPAAPRLPFSAAPRPAVAGSQIQSVPNRPTAMASLDTASEETPTGSVAAGLDLNTAAAISRGREVLIAHAKEASSER